MSGRRINFPGLVGRSVVDAYETVDGYHVVVLSDESGMPMESATPIDVRRNGSFVSLNSPHAVAAPYEVHP